MKKNIISIISALLFKLIFFPIEHFLEADLILISILIFILWKGNFMVDQYLNKKYSWVKSPQKRLQIQIIISFTFTSFFLFVFMYILHQIRFGDGRIINQRMIQLFPISLSLTFCVLTIHIGKQFYDALKNSLLETEKYKTESAIAQLQNLKNQLNPHFLFNNLSVLTSLVYKNQDKAAQFINELAKVYRYVLDSKNAELVSLQQELDFIEHYIYLQKIRFEDSVVFEINIEESMKSAYLLPMCLQMVVENTIQHNETSQANPLLVSIYTIDNTLVIENPIKLRTNVVDSSKTGLKNIELRYSFFTDEKVIVNNNEKTYKIILPLIQRK
jgi:two-component system, LytTR family, sensor kinase